jgi:hypothetical protein
MTAPDDPDDLAKTIRRITKARAAILDAQDRAPRVEFRVLAEDPEVLVARARSTATAIMSQGDMPMLCCVFSARHQQRIVLGNMPRYRTGKIKLASLLRLLVISAPIEAYFLISEAWVAQETKPPDQLTEADLPSNRPDRQEAVIVSAASQSFHHLKTFHTHRKGRAVTLTAAGGGQDRFETDNPVLENLFDPTTEGSRSIENFLLERFDRNAKTKAQT